jgi:hypothetical protein
VCDSSIDSYIIKDIVKDNDILEKIDNINKKNKK